ncbi:MAG: signal peptidase II [Myxococcota bacterium]
METFVNRRNGVFLVTTLVGLVLDQLTKWWIVENIAFRTGEIRVIDGFLSIVHAQNPGAAFGALGGYGNRFVVFGIFTLVALWVVFDMFRKLERNEWFMSMTLGLILSGALGNAIDRIRQQYVTDFIRVYTEIPAVKSFLIDNFGTYEWPSFNVADMALVIGVGMFIVHYLFIEDRSKPAAPATPEPDGVE